MESNLGAEWSALLWTQIGIPRLETQTDLRANVGDLVLSTYDWIDVAPPRCVRLRVQRMRPTIARGVSGQIERSI